MRTCNQPALAGFQKLTTSPDLGSYAVRSYSLMRPRTGRGLDPLLGEVGDKAVGPGVGGASGCGEAFTASKPIARCLNLRIHEIAYAARQYSLITPPGYLPPLNRQVQRCAALVLVGWSLLADWCGRHRL